MSPSTSESESDAGSERGAGGLGYRAPSGERGRPRPEAMSSTASSMSAVEELMVFGRGAKLEGSDNSGTACRLSPKPEPSVFLPPPQGLRDIPNFRRGRHKWRGGGGNPKKPRQSARSSAAKLTVCPRHRSVAQWMTLDLGFRVHKARPVHNHPIIRGGGQTSGGLGRGCICGVRRRVQSKLSVV